MQCLPLMGFNFFLFFFLTFGCAGSSLLHRLFSSCDKQGLLSSCGAQASHCSGFSCCEAYGLQGTWAQKLWFTGFSCSKACGIFPDQGQNPCLRPSWQANSLSMSHYGSPYGLFLNIDQGRENSVNKSLFKIHQHYQFLLHLPYTHTHTHRRTVRLILGNMPFHPQIFYCHEDISEIKEDHTMKAYKKQISSQKKTRRLQITFHYA